MSLKEVYRNMCFDEEFLNNYSETGQGKDGRIFAFQNTNYRLLLSFVKNYNTFKDGADGVDRSSWELNPYHGQESLKQHTVNMIKSRFFSKNERTYYRTKKGEVLENIQKFTDEEKWLILYFLLVDSYFNNIPSYILKRSEEIIEDLLVYQNSIDKINDTIKSFILSAKDKSIEELFSHDYIYFDTFHKPFKNYDFLSIYMNSSFDERKELYEFIIMNYETLKDLIKKSKSSDVFDSSLSKSKLINYQYDVLTKKYQPSGVFNKNMLIDNAKMLYLSHFINNNTFRDFGDYINKVVDFYSEIEEIDKVKIINFIFNNYKDIFEMCFINIFNPDYFDDVFLPDNLSVSEEEKIINKAHNTSIIEDIEEITKVSGILKRKALERANYKCELEDYCDCSSHYFTNKRTGKNYVELHHLIPREFSNDFEKSIEQIENYVSLCPRCHRFIHFAVDRERKSALHYLYSKRIDSLNHKGITIDETQLKSYYRILE